jgi:hypothetical protein
MSEVTNGSVPVEQRALTREACGRSFLLSYRRPDIDQRLGGTVVTSTLVQCPAQDCHRMQTAVVPVDGYEFATTAWHGMAGVGERSLAAIRAIALEGRGPVGGSAPRPQRRGVWQRLARWLRDA